METNLNREVLTALGVSKDCNNLGKQQQRLFISVVAAEVKPLFITYRTLCRHSVLTEAVSKRTRYSCFATTVLTGYLNLIQVLKINKNSFFACHFDLPFFSECLFKCSTTLGWNKCFTVSSVVMFFRMPINFLFHGALMSELDLCSLIQDFGSEDKCRRYLERLRWPNGVLCPECKSGKISRISERYQFDCDSCRYQFSQLPGTIFHDTHLPLWEWFLATYLLCPGPRGNFLWRNEIGFQEGKLYLVPAPLARSFAANERRLPVLWSTTA
jgi:hypothetical protein